MGLTDRDPHGPEFPSDLREAIGEFAVRFPHCPRPALLQAAQTDVLPSEVREKVREHMGTCVACTALVQDLAKLDEEPLQSQVQDRVWGRIRSGMAADEFASQAAAPRAAWWGWLFRPLPVAVASAAVILAVAGGRIAQNRHQPTAVVSQARPPQAVAPPTSTVFHPDKPPVMLPASAVLLWRGEANAAAAQGQELRQALVPYEADRYAEAARQLETLAGKYPRLAEAHFYLGVCRLFLGQNQDAAASLKTARTLAAAPLADDAAWYLAIAYHRLGQNRDAQPLLEALCRAAGKDSEKACSGLKELPVVE